MAEKLDAGKRVIAVELDPPADDDIGFFLDGVQALRDAGADAVTIADCPVGRPRADSSLLACKVKRELGIEPLPHMTCRDRNLNATKALLLGLSIEGVHNVLLVTGDPIPTEQRDEVKTVFNFNSRKLARYVSDLNEQLTSPFRIFGALNLNAKNFAMQLKIAKEKEENGVTGFLTQPVLSAQALENLKLARQELRGAILGGIFPVVSHRNALFLNNEISGMRVCDEIVALYEGKERDEAEALAVKISAAIAREIEPYVDGFYLMTPFKRVELMKRILNEIR
ncbi:MAG: homocysteine methyltransferase [Ruminococcaceae bacterium]|nr:homocysteine methyltransferase [Oscillospiraceae bacterium]